MGVSEDLTITPCSFFLPQISAYNEPDDLLCMPKAPVRHLFAQRTWRGISSLHAEELAKWHTELMNVLEEQLQPILLDQELRAEFSMNFNVAKLAVAVLNRLENESPIRGSLQSIANLAQFIRLQNCWLPLSPIGRHDPQVAALRLHRSSIQTTNRRIVFEDFVMKPSEGQNYYLRPRYVSSFDVSEHSTYTPRIFYETPGSSWLVYKDGRFHGAVPRCESGVLRVRVRATIIHNFPLVPSYSFQPRLEEVITVRVTIFPINVDTKVYGEASLVKSSHDNEVAPKIAYKKTLNLDSARSSDREVELLSPVMIGPRYADLAALDHISTNKASLSNSEMASLELSNPFAILDGHSDMDESILPLGFSFNDPGEMNCLIKMASKTTTNESQTCQDPFAKDCDGLLHPTAKDLQIARDTVCEMLLVSINLAADDSPYKEVWKVFWERARHSSDPKLLNLCRDLLLDYYFNIQSADDAETYLLLKRALKLPTVGYHAESATERNVHGANSGNFGDHIHDTSNISDEHGIQIESSYLSPARSRTTSHAVAGYSTKVPPSLNIGIVTDQDTAQLLSAQEDDGITTENIDRVRRAVACLDFSSGEDPRDVREMKKAFLHNELRGLEEGMLGRRVNRWTGDLGNCSGCSDCSCESSAFLADIAE